jgi:peptidoglycan/LPS O-acetylase OafA/YrhL
MGLHAIDRLFRGGFFGVDVFFVLSAFLITTLILEELEERAGAYDFVSFYVRRALRLGPALLLWLGLIAAPTAVAIHESSTIALSTIASLLYFGDFAIAAGARVGSAYSHVWSLAIEEQFYFVWPTALVLLTRFRQGALRGLLVGLCLVSLLTTIAVDEATGTNYFLPTGHLVPIMIGCLTAHIFLYGSPWLERIAAHRPIGVTALLTLAIVMCGFRPMSIPSGIATQCVVATATALLILNLALRPEGVAGHVMASAVPVWLGRRSYGLYLYHRTLTILIPAVISGITLKYAGPLVLALSCVITEASFRLVERPVSRLGRTWLRSRRHHGVREAESDLPVSVDAGLPATASAS